MKKSMVALFEDLMELEINFAALYKNIAEFDQQQNREIKNVANVLSREEYRHITLYKELIEDLNKKPSILIDEELMIRAKEYVIEFKQILNVPSIQTSNELLTIALEFETRNAMLLKNILELLLSNENEQVKDIIVVFEKLIIEEQKHVINIKRVLKV